MIKSIKFNKIILASFLITSFFQSCTKSVDMIAFNGNIYTVDNDFSKASAFAINNGKFIEVGTDEILSKYKSKSILNLEGSTVLPGLIDAHCHFYGLGLNQSVIDLTGTKSFNEIIEKGRKMNFPVRVIEENLLSKENQCSYPWDTPYVNTEGNVTPCCMIPDPKVVSLGSTVEKNFAEIWNSDLYQSFRNDIKSHNLREYCKNCYKSRN